MITLQSKVSIPSDILFHELAGEAVLLNLDTGKYFGLDEIGTRLWSLLAEYGNMESAYYSLLKEYEVEAARLEGDLLNLVAELEANGLVKVSDE